MILNLLMMDLSEWLLLLLFTVPFVLTVVGAAFLFKKANRPWWYALIPIGNLYVWIKVAGKSGWLLGLLIVSSIIPLLPLIIYFYVNVGMAYRFVSGKVKAILLAIGLTLLPFVFVPYLGLSDLEYKK